MVGNLDKGVSVLITGRFGENAALWLQIVYPPNSAKRAWVSGNPAFVMVQNLDQVPIVKTAPPTPAPQPASGIIFYSATDADGVNNIYSLASRTDATPTLVVKEAVQPALQPNGQRLAFHSTKNDALGLGGYDLDTGLRVRFSANVEDSLPTWNPTGNRLIFASNREGDRKWRLYVTWADGKFEATSLGFGQDPDWHPSKDLIVFKGCDDSGAHCGLWIMAADGTGRQQLTDNPSDSRPRWTPDGKTVVFMSNQRDGNWELYKITVGDGHVTRLTNDPANDGLPALSPGGNQIAFLSNRNNAWGIWVAPVDGGKAQLLALINAQLPNWLDQGVFWAK